MRKLVIAVAVGVIAGLAGSAAQAQIGIPAKLKAKKIQGNLVPAFSPMGAPSTGDDDQDAPALLGTATPRSNCTFTQGKFKLQVGKDASVKMKGVTCGGTAFSGTLCAHTKVLSSIMSTNIDKDGMSTPAVCNTSGAGDVAGKLNWSTGNVGTLTCSAGACEGTLPVVTTDPCPDVDKVAEVRHLEVFSGPDLADTVVMGTPLKACCGPGQKVAGPIAASAFAPCDTSTQDVMAEMGTITQGVAP